MKIIRIILVSVILLSLSFNTVYASWAYAFVVYNKNVYVITDKKVNTELVGSEIGQVTKYSDREGTYSGNFSNEYPKGTKYYEIVGADVNELIAVEEKDGIYIEAKYHGEYAEARNDIQTLLFYSFGIIISVILIWQLVRKKIAKL